MPKILLVDDDLTLLHSLRDFLQEVVGVQCIEARGLEDVREREKSILSGQIALAILDINLGGGLPSGIDVFHWLCAHQFQGKCIFLTGHAKEHPLVREAGALKGVEVYEKPLAAEKLISLAEEARRC